MKTEETLLKVKKAGFTHDNVDNKSVDWYTPKWIFDELGEVFDLDPCQPIEKIEWIPCKKHYSIIDNGLLQPWEGFVWLNPPYGKYTNDWLAKMDSHKNGIALVFARTDCGWFHDYIMKADAILFLQKRVRFVDGLGVTSGNGAGSGSMLIAWGERGVKALEKMKNRGALWNLK